MKSPSVSLLVTAAAEPKSSPGISGFSIPSTVHEEDESNLDGGNRGDFLPVTSSPHCKKLSDAGTTMSDINSFNMARRSVAFDNA
jgi:hypothetical protein